MAADLVLHLCCQEVVINTGGCVGHVAGRRRLDKVERRKLLRLSGERKARLAQRSIIPLEVDLAKMLQHSSISNARIERHLRDLHGGERIWSACWVNIWQVSQALCWTPTRNLGS